MIKVIYNKVCGRCVQSEPLTSGMVGQPIHFEYSHDFDGLTLTAVFTNGKTTVDVLNPSNQCVIPHEVLDTVGTLVKVGIYATKGNELVIPTVYATIGVVLKGADPSGDVSADPTLPVWAQIEAIIGNLNDLTTEAKNNLVSAINEAAQTGGGGGSTSIAMRVEGGYIQYTVDGKTWANLIAVADLKGQQGDPGKDGADGITPTIGDNGNWYLGSTDTGKPSRGVAGATGAAGPAGKDGHTPVKGVDYWTAADKSEIVEDTAAAIDLTAYAKTSDVPTKISQLENDSEFVVASELAAGLSDKQDKLIAGANITIAADGKTISATGGGGGSTVELDTTLSETGKAADAKAVGDALAGKQNTISDLEAIRSGAAKGATALQSVPSTYRTASEQDTIDSGKVDKVTGKGLSSNDYTDAAKAKVDALAPVATSGNYNDLSNKPTIPAPVTEQTVSGWGFTKNTGTYSKPAGGIPKADLAAAVQTSLGKADTALQEHQSLAAYRTAAAQDNIDITKQDKLIAGENITIAEDGKTISATGGGGVLPVTLTLGAPIQQGNSIEWYYTADKGQYEIKDAIDAGITVLKCSLIYEDNPNEVADVIYLNFSSMDSTAVFVGFDLPGKYYELRFPITSSIEGMFSYITLPTKTSELENDAGYLTLATLPKYEGVVE